MSGKAFPQCLPSPAPRGIRPRRFPPSPCPSGPLGASGEQGMRKSRGFSPGPQWGRNAVLLLGCVGCGAGRPKPISRKAIGLNGRGGAHGRRRMEDSPPYAGHASRIGLNGRGKEEKSRHGLSVCPRGRRAGYSPPSPLSDEGPCHLLPAKALILSALAALNSSLRALSLPLLYDTSFAGHSK